jgi:hypothetical protein
MRREKVGRGRNKRHRGEVKTRRKSNKRRSTGKKNRKRKKKENKRGYMNQRSLKHLLCNSLKNISRVFVPISSVRNKKLFSFFPPTSLYFCLVMLK